MKDQRTSYTKRELEEFTNRYLVSIIDSPLAHPDKTRELARQVLASRP